MSKVTKSHSTFIPEAEEVRSFLEKIPEVQKLTAGFIKSVKPSSRRIKIKLEPACVLLAVRGVCAIQEMRVYVDSVNAASVVEAIEAFAIDNQWKT